MKNRVDVQIRSAVKLAIALLAVQFAGANGSMAYETQDSKLSNLIQISPDFEASGRPALGHKPITWVDEGPTPEDVAQVTFLRRPNYNGGVPAFTNSALRAYSQVGPRVTNYEWSFLAVMDNGAAAGENVAGYFQGLKKSTGPTWGTTSEAIDTTGVPNPTTGLVGMEVDVRANGSDLHGSRVGIDVVATRPYLRGAPSGAAMDAGWGIRIQSGGDSQSNVKIGYGFYPQTKTQVAFDASDANVSDAALRLAAGDAIAFDKSSGNLLKFDGKGLAYVARGKTQARLNANGTVQSAVFTVSTLPKAGNMGARAFVTDAKSAEFRSVAVGGGTNRVPVFDDGEVWRVG